MIEKEPIVVGCIMIIIGITCIVGIVMIWNDPAATYPGVFIGFISFASALTLVRGTWLLKLSLRRARSYNLQISWIQVPSRHLPALMRSISY